MNKRILTISIITLTIDYLAKSLVDCFMKVGSSITIIPNFFSLSYYQNSGISFSFLEHKFYLILVISFIALLVIYRYMHSFQNNLRNNIAFGLLFGGIIGNLLDRLIFGYVRDFIDFRIFNYNAPVFNIADMAIVIGVFLLIIAVFRKEDHNAVSSKK